MGTIQRGGKTVRRIVTERERKPQEVLKSRVGPGSWNNDGRGEIYCREGVRAKVCENKRTPDDEAKVTLGSQRRNNKQAKSLFVGAVVVL